jgi:hypothetical protein
MSNTIVKQFIIDENCFHNTLKTLKLQLPIKSAYTLFSFKCPIIYIM